MRRPRMVLRMITNGAAKVSTGMARNVDEPRARVEQTEAQRPLGDELIAGRKRTRDRKADQQHDERLERLRAT